MMILSCVLGFAALVTLSLGFEAWRLTSSNTVCMNTFMGTAALAFAAYSARAPGNMALAAAIPFFVAMLFGGRALGIFWRSRDGSLLLPSRLMFTVAGTSLLAAVAVLCWR